MCSFYCEYSFCTFLHCILQLLRFDNKLSAMCWYRNCFYLRTRYYSFDHKSLEIGHGNNSVLKSFTTCIYLTLSFNYSRILAMVHRFILTCSFLYCTKCVQIFLYSPSLETFSTPRSIQNLTHHSRFLSLRQQRNQFSSQDMGS